MIPAWLHFLSIAALLTGFVSALIILVDVTRHPQHMFIMNVVWPVVALFAGPIALWSFFRYSRLATREVMKPAIEKGETPPAKKQTLFPVMVGKGAAHCGSGCTLGDIIAEWLCFAVPAVAVWFGWKSVFAEKIFAVWIVDYIFAFCFGIVF